VVNRAALTGCTGRDHESNKNQESDVRGARPEGILPNEQSELVTKGGTNLIVHARFIYVAARCI
jgi:hypothetical protein